MPARLPPTHLTPLLVLLCLYVCPARGDTPIPFGLPVQYRDVVTVLDFADGRDASELANVDEAQARLEETERNLGPYHPALAAEFVQVAELAMEAGVWDPPVWSAYRMSLAAWHQLAASSICGRHAHPTVLKG